MLKCAIIGATGLVGRMFLKVMEERQIQFSLLDLYASKKSAGKEIVYMQKKYIIKELTHQATEQEYDYCLFSAGADISREYALKFAKAGSVVIDNSSAFRMVEGVPLVVPEINMEKVGDNLVIANPNCSTIQAVMALKPLYDKYGIERIIYSTYQAVSGAGQQGIDDLDKKEHKKFPYVIYDNCIPQIDDFLPNGYTKEEMKLINETKKILGDDKLKISATCVRVPVHNCHGMCINVQLKKHANVDDIKQLLSCSEGVVVQDEPSYSIYPLCGFATNTDNVYVGRIREDQSHKNTFNMWVVADNIRKGAATNAVQILEKHIQKRKDK